MTELCDPPRPTSRDGDPFERSLPVQLNQIYGLLAVNWTRFFAKFGLSLRQGRLLMFLGTHAPISAKQTAVRLAMDKAGVSRAIVGLEEQSLIRRFPDPNLRRSWMVELTLVGQRLHEQVSAAYAARTEALLERFAGPERAQFSEFVARLRDQLVEMNGGEQLPRDDLDE